jgi:hypothetical protein
MLNYFKTLWRPEVYHGTGKKIFFEGWFFKIVDHAKKNCYAFIPGISLGDDPHAFIQILDGQTHQSDYRRFPMQDFKASSKKLEIQIGDNIFTETYFESNIETANRFISGRIDFDQLTSWPVKLISPGAMGWYAFVPFMECFHGVVSFDHVIQGTLSINGNKIEFDNGRGYIEKDWGRSFPSAYIWIQSNHFEQPGISLIVSVAKIPWLTGAFRGFIIGLLLDDKLYRFATYSGARLHYLRMNDSLVELSVSDGKFLLSIEAVRSDCGLLHAPYKMNMLKRVSETLSSEVKIDLYQVNKNEKDLIFTGTGNPAGLDVNGRLEEIVDA